MERKFGEFFGQFIENKKMAVSDGLCLLESCADRLDVLQEFFISNSVDEDQLSRRQANGLASILNDIQSDIRLVSEDRTLQFMEKVEAAELKNRQVVKKSGKEKGDAKGEKDLQKSN